MEYFQSGNALKNSNNSGTPINDEINMNRHLHANNNNNGHVNGSGGKFPKTHSHGNVANLVRKEQ